MTIMASLNQPQLLRAVVELIASRHVDLGYSKATVPSYLKAIDTSCTQAYVLGTFNLYEENDETTEPVNIPFITSFLFTCIKDRHGIFNLEWSSSLS